MESAKKYNSKLCGIFLVIGGIASALLSKDNGCYDITAALFFSAVRFSNDILQG